MEELYVIRRADLPGLLERLGAIGDVYAPSYEDGVAVLSRVQAGSQDNVAWDFPKPAVPPKEMFFPHTERFLRFRREGKAVAVEPVDGVTPLVILGAKPCDMAAIDMVRRVMIEGRFTDQSFDRRRAMITAVTVACEEEGEYCFCSSLGQGPCSTRGSDLMLYPAGDTFYAVPLTANGERAVQAGGDLFRAAGTPELEEAKKRLEERFRGSPQAGAKLPASARLPAEAVRAASRRMAADFDLPYWREASERCLGCGICTFLCPTCYCFSVVDRLRGSEGTRSRCWDACMFEGYAKMAGGHNPRPTKLERVRQRFMHKLVYNPERHGEVACAGCGRCVEKCPVGLHIACVVSDIAG
ncbi:MAG: 4Fe-4S dicluster domain-containing protein [Ignavibacteriales bacterium]